MLLSSQHKDQLEMNSIIVDAEMLDHKFGRITWTLPSYLWLVMITILFVFYPRPVEGGSFDTLNDTNTSVVDQAAWAEGGCRSTDISIVQSRERTSGVPRFVVQVMNTCIAGCAPADIHLSCGNFASARMVNPSVFRRLRFNDCLLNSGRPLPKNRIIRFTYDNSFMYRLALKSATFCRYP